MVAGKLVPHLRIGLHVSACVHVLTPVWVWFGRREDPHETKDLAHELPDVLESLKQRYLELKATRSCRHTRLPHAGFPAHACL